ncbi:hypothetical protein ACC848_42835, partial [Rhizobium johnstonii]
IIKIKGIGGYNSGADSLPELLPAQQMYFSLHQKCHLGFFQQLHPQLLLQALHKPHGGINGTPTGIGYGFVKTNYQKLMMQNGG